MTADYLPSVPVNQALPDINPRIGTDDSSRLRDLLFRIQNLNTDDMRYLYDYAHELVDYSREVAQQIGLDFKNPPVPPVMCSTVKGCPPNGEQAGRCDGCPGNHESKAKAERRAFDAALRAVRGENH